jgi:hypothetical protein
MMAGAGALHTVFDELSEIDANGLAFAAGLPCFQDFLYRSHQAVSIFEHEPVEVAPLCVIDMGLAALEGLQVQADGCNGSFQFMSDGVNKAIVLFIAANFANQKTGIENQTGRNRTKKDDPEKDFDIVLPIQNDPAETDGNRNCGQHYPESEKESDFAAPANPHAQILARYGSTGPKSKLLTAEIAQKFTAAEFPAQLNP